MPGLKKHHADVRFSGNKVTPDELDLRQQYVVMYPSIGTATVGTAAAGTVDVAWDIITKKADYPRNVVFISVGPAGGVGGTCVINGTDQFGVGITETISFASAAAGGTKSGTKVFDTFTSGTYYPNGGDNTSTATLGYSKGTAANNKAIFGLPVKINAVADVKRLTWIANGTQTDINAGTIDSDRVNTTAHAFAGTQTVAATDIYVVDVLSTYDSSLEGNVA